MHRVSAERVAPGGVPLTRLAEGRRAIVTELLHAADPAMARLVAVGVLPGAELTLVQRYPAFIFEVGHTEFAVDQELAGRIVVRPAQRASCNVQRAP
jgi:DtxR family Mn-dependent transcriptional regulator